MQQKPRCWDAAASVAWILQKVGQVHTPHRDGSFPIPIHAARPRIKAAPHVTALRMGAYADFAIMRS